MELEERGVFVTFEGIEGCGKSTQAKMLYENLIEEGYDVIATREPGATAIGRVIRDTLLSTKYTEMEPLSELFLFAASRAQHIKEIIKPALETGRNVICDRYIDSTIAYQAYGRGLDFIEVMRVSDLASAGLLPDLTILLDIPVDESMRRISQDRLDRIEQTGKDFHERIRAGYLELAARNPDRIKLIEGSRDVAAINRDVTEAVTNLL